MYFHVSSVVHAHMRKMLDPLYKTTHVVHLLRYVQICNDLWQMICVVSSTFQDCWQLCPLHSLLCFYEHHAGGAYYCIHHTHFTYALLLSFQYSSTPLDTASCYGSLYVVRVLLQRGAKVDSRDRVRQSYWFTLCKCFCVLFQTALLFLCQKDKVTTHSYDSLLLF